MLRTPTRSVLFLTLLGASWSCADDGADPAAEAEAPVVGSCRYTSPFTQGAECREYVGEAWSDEQVGAACQQLGGELELAGRCATDGTLGQCDVDTDSTAGIVIFAYGDDESTCPSQRMGCEVFGGGTWQPSEVCDGVEGGGGGGGSVFIQPTLECREPLEGEPPGQGPDGQVCTWQAISGCTEEGRRFDDYASCEVVRTQRPAYAAPPAEGSGQEDPRLNDSTYAGELDWVRSQVVASACVCCHSEDSPGGASNWSVDAPGNWIDSFRDTGLALGAGWVSSVAFGAYPQEENNGFERETSGFPSTDPERMRDFFIAELEHRGRTQADFADTPPFGGPIYDQLVYTPEACSNGEGVSSDGRITWDGGAARYVQVLDAGSANPTVPPNLDLPEGTRWRLDVPATGSPVESGDVFYGDAGSGTSQRFPAEAAPADLEVGNTYYLYVSRDVGIPLTRCLFTY